MPERVWDRFLTEQDHAHLAMSAHRRLGFGKRPALLLVDLYRWVFGDRPEPLLEAIKTWPTSCGLAAWEAIPPIQALLKAAREARIPIVHMTGLEQSGMEGWTAWRRQAVADLKNPAKRRWTSSMRSRLCPAKRFYASLLPARFGARRW
jgi:nicotinamidase-related amidase